MTVTPKTKVTEKTIAENGRYSDHLPLPEAITTPPVPQYPILRPTKWGLAIAATIITLFLLWYVREGAWNLISLVGDQDAVSQYLIGYGAWGPIALAVAQLIQVLVAVIPGHVFLVAAGYVYGFWPGLILNMICIVAASQLGFALARWTGRPVVDRLVDKKTLDKWYAIGEKQGFIFFTIAFILPMFPTDMMNFVAGLTGIRGTQFLAANILGRLPSAIMLTMIGAYGVHFAPWHWVVIGLFVAIIYVTGRIVVRRIEKTHEAAEDERR